jgi:hypothetical protein
MEHRNKTADQGAAAARSVPLPAGIGQAMVSRIASIEAAFITGQNSSIYVAFVFLSLHEQTGYFTNDSKGFLPL